MKIYGYTQDDDELLELQEVSIQLSLDELITIGKFFEYVKSQMVNNPNSFGHEHLSDFYKLTTNSDIILIKADST